METLLPIPNKHEVIKTYGEKVHSLSENKTALVLTGSYATGTPSIVSDLDVHIIVGKDQENLDFEEVREVLLREYELRNQVGEHYELPGLTRHYASVFATDSYRNHFRSLLWRYGIPSNLGEHRVVSGHVEYEHLMGDEHKEIDLAVTISERLGNYTRTNDLKWLVLNYRDIQLFGHSGLYNIQNILSFVENLDQRSREALATEQQFFSRCIAPLTGSNRDERIKLHKITWTLEKITWELVDCSISSIYAKDYKDGLRRNFGFSPKQLVDLITNCQPDDNKNTSKTCDDLIDAIEEFVESRRETALKTEALYKHLGKWATLLVHEKLKCIS